MAALTVRNIPDSVHRALRVRAAQHGHSTEAEVREILANTVLPADRPRMGEAIARLSKRYSLTDEDIALFEAGRDQTLVTPMDMS